MRIYTPINEFKVKSKDAKDFLAKAKKIRLYSVENIHVPTKIFDELVGSLSPSTREYYLDGIPFEGKLLVRK